MLDLVSVLCGTIRSEDLPYDVWWEEYFIRRDEAGAHSSAVGRAPRRSYLFCGICALAAAIVGTVLRGRATARHLAPSL